MGFKINYKGHNRDVKYTYQCYDCDHIQEEWHSMRDDPEIACQECGKACRRVLLKCPSLGADYHDSQLSHNLGWPEDE